MKVVPTNFVTAIKLADEIWIATALLHREHPERVDFSVSEIVQRAIRENLAGGYRQGLQMHASHHCVAQKAPNPASTRHRMLTETGRGRRRLFRPGDAVHPARFSGKTTPAAGDVPAKYRDLLRWYREEFSRSGDRPTPAGRTVQGTPGAVLLQFAGTIPADDLARMQHVIDQECEQLDRDE